MTFWTPWGSSRAKWGGAATYAAVRIGTALNHGRNAGLVPGAHTIRFRFRLQSLRTRGRGNDQLHQFQTFGKAVSHRGVSRKLPRSSGEPEPAGAYAARLAGRLRTFAALAARSRGPERHRARYGRYSHHQWMPAGTRSAAPRIGAPRRKGGNRRTGISRA